MRGSIVFAIALFAVLAFAPTSQASPLMPAAGITNAAAENGVVEQARYHARYRHRGWSRGHHYGWRHRHHPHRY